MYWSIDLLKHVKSAQWLRKKWLVTLKLMKNIFPLSFLMLTSPIKFLSPKNEFECLQFFVYWWNRQLHLISNEQMQEKKKISHPALISTPPATWTGEVCKQQVRNALVWLKLGITTSETLSLSLTTGVLGTKRSPRRHSIWTACPMTGRQSSLMTQVAVTGDPKGTTELEVRMIAHCCMTSSDNKKIHFSELKMYKEWECKSSPCSDQITHKSFIEKKITLINASCKFYWYLTFCRYAEPVTSSIHWYNYYFKSYYYLHYGGNVFTVVCLFTGNKFSKIAFKSCVWTLSHVSS